MGGFIALTVRYSDGQEYRGSCWTNVLPEGLFSHEFYFKETSEAHARKWLDRIIKNRKKNKGLEEMWGGWNKLAPESYGIVLVDYKTGTLIAGNGYTDVQKIHTFPDPAKIGKFIRLHEAGLLAKVKIRIEEDERRQWRDASEEEVKAFVGTVSDKVYFDPEKEEWLFTSLRADKEVTHSPLMEAEIKLWFPKVLSFDRGDLGRWKEAREWVESNFELSAKEKKAWAAWIREEEGARR